MVESEKMFTCAYCGKTEPAHDDADEAEALAELARDFPGVNPADCVKICQTCYDRAGEMAEDDRRVN